MPTKFGNKLNQTDNLSTLEWNSIFLINDDCNVDSIFREGENRDTVFYQELEAYVEDQLNGRLKDHLWGNYIDDETCELSTRDPQIKKTYIIVIIILVFR